MVLSLLWGTLFLLKVALWAHFTSFRPNWSWWVQRWVRELSSGAFTDLHCLVEDAAADLNHFQVLFLLVPRTLDVRHPAPLVLLTGVYEVPDRAVLIEDLQGAAVKFLKKRFHLHCSRKKWRLNMLQRQRFSWVRHQTGFLVEMLHGSHPCNNQSVSQSVSWLIRRLVEQAVSCFPF